MDNYIVFLKGINVGGHKKVPMAELRSLLSQLGFENIQTYIQSGNILLNTSQDKLAIERIIFEGIKSHFGFESNVLVKTAKDLQHVFNNCPFSEEKKKSSHFLMFHDTPTEDMIIIALEKTYEDEEFYILQDCLYFYSIKGYGKVKFSANFFERKFKTFGTSRSYNTMVKLLSLSSENS